MCVSYQSVSDASAAFLWEFSTVNWKFISHIYQILFLISSSSVFAHKTAMPRVSRNVFLPPMPIMCGRSVFYINDRFDEIQHRHVPVKIPSIIEDEFTDINQGKQSKIIRTQMR